MESRYYQILKFPIKVSSNFKQILQSLDKVYCAFKQDKLDSKPVLELIIDSINGDLTDLNSFKIFSITPSSFDGWSSSSKIWCGVDILNRYVFEIDKAPSEIKLDKNKQKLFEIKTRTKPLGVKAGWLLQLHFHINLFVLHYSESCFFIHGGALEWQNKGLILAGSSGSGKSTLTYALAKSGLRFLADESIIFDIVTNKLLSYHVSPSFEEECKNIFKEIADSFEEDKQLGNNSHKSFLNIKKLGISTSNEPVEPSVIIFPKYSPTEKPAIKTVRKNHAAELFTKYTGFFQRPDEPKMSRDEALILLINKCDCYELISSDLDETVRLVKDVLTD